MAKAQAYGSGSTPDGYRGASAPPVAAPVWKHRVYIDRPAALHTLAADLTSARILAIDAEFVQVRKYGPADPSHRLMLLQFASDNDYDTSYVVDALRVADLSPLQTALSDGAILKLFHGISADARVLATRGLSAHHTLDLEATSRSIFGQRESGLQAMLQRACAMHLDKTLQRADWSRRPLTSAMIAYAARDAEMTYVLYGWLKSNYPWAVALHEVAANEHLPPVAGWLLPYIESSRNRPVELAVVEAGLANNIPAQVRDLRAALGLLPHPGQRVRVMRLISDLNLTALAPDLHPYLAAPASEERGGALRTLGRLRDRSAQPQMRALLEDPVQDVRQMAQNALDHIKGTGFAVKRPPRPGATNVWTVGAATSEPQGDPDDWRARLRARFAVSSSSDITPSGDEPAPGERNEE